jgi:hypothetical protein
MRKPSWNDTENAALVALYFVMQDKAAKGQAYVKAAMIREAQGTDEEPGALHTRSRGSIEAKLMNVSGVLKDLGREDVSMADHGYVPMSNYQSDLKTMVVALLAVADEARNGGFEVSA